ncbi:cation:proton antiporter [Piscinibacter sp.]|uniref:cation:proton antiporter n=1 Tax=Piscinibacter sp. TaxID=1903157 RepID=UPI002C534A6A|nr:cation:proton antiporter [Albitalea sp.]HUG21129.1 cation:proton antiporter [Albitalea sp.]
MPSLLPVAADLAWPFAVALAWIAGELGHRWLRLPRISMYGLVGFGLAATQLGVLPSAADSGSTMLLANIAFGLILFEFGYRINLRWLRTNPWIAATGLLEAAATFVAVYVVAAGFGMSALTSLLLASIAMSTSPAAVMRVVNEQRSSGQVTERVLHLSAFNCVLAVFAFKVVVGFWTYESSGSVLHAVSNSLVVLGASAGLGAVFGLGVPALLRRIGRLSRDATVAFALAVILLVAITHALKLSPVLAALTFGFAARHRRVALNQAQRNFGALGDLLAIVLFVFVATTLEWHRVLAGAGLALALIAVRSAAKVLAVASLARVSGVSWRKGVLTGLALTPISVFAILVLEESRFLGIDFIDQLAPLAAATLLLDLIGPVVTQRSLMAAGESAESTDT